jgi:hypothetical protein
MSPGTGCEASVDLYWIPLGSGGHVVRWNGMVYEALKAFAGHRERCALYHSALEVTTSDARYVIEVTPVPDHDGRDRGVVGEGPVGVRSLGRLRSFRYEIRRWRDGVIPDAGDLGTRVVRVADDAITAERVLASLPSVPKPVWGRTSSQPAICGTRTRWSRGSSQRPALRWSASPFLREAGDRAGMPGSSLPAGRRSGRRALAARRT